MDLYIALRTADKAPLFREVEHGEVLMVFVDQDVARREISRLGELAFVAEIPHDTVVRRLRETGDERLVIVLEPGELYLTDVRGLEHAAARFAS
jgi:hypothetical protein